MDYSEQIKRLVDFSRINAYAGHWEDSEFFTEVKKTLEKLIHENEQLRNEHLKIQYGGEELTVSELCTRLREAEARAEKKIKQLTPCDMCAYDPPSSGDGKPCSFCPASKKED